MGGMTTHLSLLAAETGEYPGFSANFSGDGFAWMRFVAKAVPAGDFDAWVAQVRSTGSALDDAAYAAIGKAERSRAAGDLSLGRAQAVRTHHRPDNVGPRKGERRYGLVSAGARRQEVEMLGRLSWAEIPFYQPLPISAMGGGRLRHSGRAWGHHRERVVALSVARVDHQRRPQAHRRDVFRSGADHAGARLCRRDHDALAAGDRHRRRPGIPAARSLRPDLFLTRHDHDFFCGDAVCHRADELCRAIAARRARRRLSRCTTRSAFG